MFNKTGITKHQSKQAKMNRFNGVGVLPQQQPQQSQQQTNQPQSQSSLFNPNLQQQQQQQQNSFIQQQYMSATQPLTTGNMFNNNNNNNNIRFSQQFNSNPILQNNNNINTTNNNNNTTTNQSNNSSSPQWFTNSKKRTIPQNIVKRPIFKRGDNNNNNNNKSNSSNKNNDDLKDDGFNTISFGSKKIVTFNNDNDLNKNKNNPLSTNDNNILNDSNEAPPMISLHDWQREEEFGSMPNLSNNNSKSITGNSLFTLRSTKSSGNVNNIKSHMLNVNAFDKDSSSLRQSTNNPLNNTSTTKTNSDDVKKQQVEAFAIIVFGYPESVSNVIINHFAKFGNILEDFEILRSVTGINKINNNTTNHSQTKKYPIFTGDGWIKLTYDSQASAIRALQENGKVITGCILGVVPYNKEVVEQLASCKISKDENIGGNGIITSNQTSTTTNTNPLLPTLEKNITTTTTPPPTTINNITTPQPSIFNNSTSINTATTTNNNNETHNNSTQNSNFTFTNRLNVKDGKSLFIHNTNTNNHNFLQNLENKMRQQEQLSETNTINGVTPNINSNKQNNGMLHSVNNWLFGWNNL